MSSGVYFSKESLDSALNVIVQFLRDSGYEGSLDDGTGISDVVLKPSAMLYTLFAQQVEKATAYQSLQKAQELKASIGQSEYDEAVDAIMSNWFVSRNEGTRSTGTLRLWFLEPISFLHFKAGALVGATSGHNLVASSEYVFTSEDFSAILNTANNVEEYYVDVHVETADNTDYAPVAGESVNASVGDIYFLRAEIPADFIAGTSKEATDDFISRTRQAITTRELITERAINTVLRENFDQIYSVYVARHGSEEQIRDIIPFEGILVHVGNKADIYVAEAMSRQSLRVAAGQVDMSQFPTNGTFLHILSVKDDEGNDVPYTLYTEEDAWGAICDSVPSLFIDAPEDSAATVTWLYDPFLTDIHDFVYSDDQRVTCYDPRVRHKFPAVMRFNIRVLLEDETLSSESAIREAVEAYVTSLAKSGGTWSASELISAIHYAVPNVKKVYMPIEGTCTLFDPKASAPMEAELGNNFSVDSFLKGYSKQISANTVQFYTDKDLIDIEVV